MDEISTTRLQEVNPKLRDLIIKLDSILSPKGINIRVVQGYRSIEEQNVLYAQGRTTPGPKVTNAPGGHSYHNFGMAVDVIPGLRNTPTWEPNWNPQHPDFKEMISEAIGLGLVSGSCWTSLKDYPHLQLPDVPVSPTPLMLTQLEESNLEKFWDIYVKS